MYNLQAYCFFSMAPLISPSYDLLRRKSKLPTPTSVGAAIALSLQIPPVNDTGTPNFLAGPARVPRAHGRRLCGDRRHRAPSRSASAARCGPSKREINVLASVSCSGLILLFQQFSRFHRTGYTRYNLMFRLAVSSRPASLRSPASS